MRKLVSLPFLALILAGCGPSKGSVSGVVTVGGKPLKGGTITFLQQKGDAIPMTYPINDDGTFSVSDLPFGTFNISVAPAPGDSTATSMGAAAAAKVRSEEFDRTGQTMPRDILDAGRPSGPDPKANLIPEKYRDPLTSELTITIDSATVQHNVVIP